MTWLLSSPYTKSATKERDTAEKGDGYVAIKDKYMGLDLMTQGRAMRARSISGLTVVCLLLSGTIQTHTGLFCVGAALPSCSPKGSHSDWASSKVVGARLPTCEEDGGFCFCMDASASVSFRFGD